MKRSILLLMLMVATVLMCLTAAPAHATRMAVDERGLMPGSDSLTVKISQQAITDGGLTSATQAGDLWQAGHRNQAATLPDHWQLERAASSQRPALSAWVTPSEPATPILRTLDPASLSHQPDPALAPITLMLLASGLIGLTLLRQQQPA